MFAWQKVNRIRSKIITHFQTKTMIQSTEPHRPWVSILGVVDGKELLKLN